MHKVGRLSAYAVLALAFLCHMTVLPHMKIFHAQPDLLLICVIFFGLFLGPDAGLEAGMASGLLKDIFSLDFLGINMFISGLVGLAAGAANKKIFRDSKITQLLLVFLFSALSLIIHYWLISIFSKPLNLNLFESFVGFMAPSAIYTSLAAVPVFSKLVKIYKLQDPEDLL